MHKITREKEKTEMLLALINDTSPSVRFLQRTYFFSLKSCQ
nr:MAG TPA: hypothetical protein [Caudoviricetes sp.]